MKNTSQREFTRVPAWITGLFGSIVLAWLSWVSVTLVDLKTEVGVLKYAVLKKVAKIDEMKSEGRSEASRKLGPSELASPELPIRPWYHRFKKLFQKERLENEIQ